MEGWVRAGEAVPKTCYALLPVLFGPGSALQCPVFLSCHYALDRLGGLLSGLRSSECRLALASSTPGTTTAMGTGWSGRISLVHAASWAVCVQINPRSQLATTGSLTHTHSGTHHRAHADERGRELVTWRQDSH